jgi:hypothetical protein
MVILYLGPNTVMPLASIVAAIVGVILIFWRFIYRLVRRGLQTFQKKDPSTASTNQSESDTSN